MRRLILFILVIILSGCATLTYRSPDGTEVTYSRLFTTSDVIKGKVGDASIQAQGQQVIDPAALQTILGIILRGQQP